jgi:hypothetical protein
VKSTGSRARARSAATGLPTVSGSPSRAGRAGGSPSSRRASSTRTCRGPWSSVAATTGRGGCPRPRCSRSTRPSARSWSSACRDASRCGPAGARQLRGEAPSCLHRPSGFLPSPAAAERSERGWSAHLAPGLRPSSHLRSGSRSRGASCANLCG